MEFLHGFGMAPDNGSGASGLGSGNYSDPNQACKVTRDGSIYDLFEQTTYSVDGSPQNYGFNANYPYMLNDANVGSQPGTSPADEATRFLKQRMKQILPTVSDLTMNNIIGCPGATNPQKLKLGHKYYIFMNNAGNLVMMDAASTACAPGGTEAQWINGFTAAEQQPDGTKRKFSCSYNLWGFVNSVFDWNIHWMLFTQWSGTVQATDTAYYQPAMGAYDLLGVAKFSQTVNFNGSLMARD